MISRDRRKELLFEIMSESNHVSYDIYLPNINYEKNLIINNLDSNFVFQDKFCISMHMDDFTINPDRIKGFRIEQKQDKRIIKVKTFLHIDSWLKDFEKIEIIKIYFFDSIGSPVKNHLDYDVDFKFFYLDCDYKFRDYLTPVYEYEILDNF